MLLPSVCWHMLADFVALSCTYENLMLQTLLPRRVVKCCELPNPGQEEQVVPTAEVPYNAKPSAEAFGAGT